MSRVAKSERRRTTERWSVSVAIALACSLPFPAAHAIGADDRVRKECELGITLAFSGEPARAESVFISLLSHFPGDAGAFTNLGNLHLLAGDPEVALGFYRQAGIADTSDAGIILNQATAWLLLGDEAEAEERARVGVRMAGGAPAAASLLGIYYREIEGSPRGAEKAHLSREEMLEMLRTTLGRVPADSLRAGGRFGREGATAGKRRGPQWRAAGPRADEAQAALPALVYWKR